jgi:uncharacterized protein YbjQ (UPF0145 family)
LRRLIAKVKGMGVSAIVGVDFETSDMLQETATLFSACGTAVIARPIEEKE